MSTSRAFAASRLALRRTTSGLRCASEMHTTTSATRSANVSAPTLQCNAGSSFANRRYYGAPAYQSYSLPTNTTSSAPLPTQSGRPSQGEALPHVNETRPPKDAAHSAQETVKTGIDSATTAEIEQPPAAVKPDSTTATAKQQRQQAAAPVAEPKAAKKPPPSKRPRSMLRAVKAPLKLTPAAVEQLREILDGPDPKLIKVGVKNRGCSGLSYHLDWVDEAGKFDEEVVQDGVKVLIDNKALFSIIGSEMDWVEDKLVQKFVFKNPNIKEECGCGESFMI